METGSPCWVTTRVSAFHRDLARPPLALLRHSRPVGLALLIPFALGARFVQTFVARQLEIDHLSTLQRVQLAWLHQSASAAMLFLGFAALSVAFRFGNTRPLLPLLPALFVPAEKALRGRPIPEALAQSLAPLTELYLLMALSLWIRHRAASPPALKLLPIALAAACFALNPLLPPPYSSALSGGLFSELGWIMPLCAVVWAGTSPRSRAPLAFALNPAQWFAPRCDEHELAGTAEEYLRTLAAALRDLALFLPATLATPYALGLLARLEWGGPRFGLAAYITAFLLSYSLGAFGSFALRATGVDCLDSFDLPLLAASPQDRWRRWNSFIAFFCLRFLFLPCYRLSGLLLPAVLVSFFYTFAIHSPRALLYALPGSAHVSEARAFLQVSASFFLVQALLVYGGIRLQTRLPAAETRRGWAAVLLTQLLVAGSHCWWIR